MARKSKRLVNISQESPIREGIYNVALYLRLSVEERKDIAKHGSIEYQKQIGLNYLQNKPEMKLYDIYIDDGETGTNFDRDGFQRMMFDVYNGKVNCIVVKDLSRFGREYIEMGDYVEKIFPLLGIRFIAVNDEVDNLVKPLDISVPIKNVINAMYAKDLSKKIASTARMKQINGEFTGGIAPYGYNKSTEEKNKFVIDPEAAEVVKKIFEMKLQKMSTVAICRRLFDLNIMPPSRYNYERGIFKNKKFATAVYWSPNIIQKILTSEMYIGNMVQGKRKSHFYNGMPAERVKREDWIVVENTHEPIISREVFDEVQKIIQEGATKYADRVKNFKRSKNNNIFKGKVVCGDCGTKLKRSGFRTKKGFDYYYSCNVHSVYPTECNVTSIKDSILKNLVFTSIKMQLSSLVSIEETLNKASQTPEVRKEMFSLTSRISESLANVAYLKESRVRLTKDYANQLLDEEEYEAVRTQFEFDMQAELKRLEEYENMRNKFSKLLSSDKWVSDLKKYTSAKKLTAEMVDAFVDKIKVHADKRIEIVWKYTESFAEYATAINGGVKLAG